MNDKLIISDYDTDNSIDIMFNGKKLSENKTDPDMKQLAIHYMFDKREDFVKFVRENYKCDLIICRNGSIDVVRCW